jgi:hypothetical protein
MMACTDCPVSAVAVHYFLRTPGGRRLRALKLASFRNHALTRKQFYVDDRLGNKHRDRRVVLLKLTNMGDAYFKRMFRLDRPTFSWLLELIRPKIQGSEKQACCSSGSPIFPEIKLAIALRFLAGGIYLDLAFAFDISHKHVMKYVWEVFEAVDQLVNNIVLPLGNEQKLRDLEQGFLSISKSLFPGTVGAGDGVVFRIQRPPKAAVGGDVSSFFTRKGYYAYGMQILGQR